MASHKIIDIEGEEVLHTIKHEWNYYLRKQEYVGQSFYHDESKTTKRGKVAMRKHLKEWKKNENN